MSFIPKVNCSRWFAFQADGEIWYSPNFDRAQTVPRVPSPDFRFTNQTLLKDLQFQPQWWTRGYAWMGFIPCKPPFDGALQFLDSCPIVAVRDGFQLAPQVISQWMEFHRSICLMMQAFGDSQELEQSVNGAPDPLDTGFHQVHRTRGAAFFCSRRAREVFVLMLSLLSYMMSIGNLDYLPMRMDRWFQNCVKLGVAHRFLDGVKSSSMFSFDGRIRRVGIFRRIFYDTDPPTVNFYIQRGVPVFYPWGRVEEKHISGISGKYYLPYKPPQTTSDMANKPTPPPVPAADSPLDEPWIAFFQERERRQAARPITSSEGQKIKNRQTKPPIANTKMYHWEENDLGRRVRTSVPKRAFSDMFENYSEQQMRYDPRENEWDICTLWGEGPEENDDNLGYYLGFDDLPATSNTPTSNDTAINELPVALTTEHREVSQVWTSRSTPDLATADVITTFAEQTVVNLLQKRFGFLPPLSLALYQHGYREVESKEWGNLVHALGGDVNKESKPSYAGALVDFVKGMGMAKKETKHHMQPSSNPPYILYDLLSDGPVSFFQKRYSMTVRCYDANDTCWNYDAYGVRTIHTHQSDDNPPYFYEVAPISQFAQTSRTTWSLYLTRAVDVFHCLRRMDQATLHEVARYLVENGIPFSTRLPLQLQETYPTPPPRLRAPDYRQHIPLRLKGYKFTLWDYSSYENQCVAILNQPHGRAALLMGGIVWRRARDILSLDGVLEGPSSSVRNFGKGSCLQPIGGQNAACYWDDALDQEELDIICGLYHCHTDNTNKSTGEVQIAFKSWWPTHTLWASPLCGYNLGFWSEYCEKWYQMRLREINEGRAEPLSGTQWRNYLKSVATGRHVKLYSEGIARNKIPQLWHKDR